MTNLALLARVYPEAFASIGRIVFMGGGVDISNATAAAEFNVFHDPEATAIVLDACASADVPVTMYGLDVFYDPLVTDTHVDGLRALGTPVADLAAGLISFHHRRFANAGATIGDAGAVGILIEPDAVVTQRLPVRVELTGTWTRGRTVVDRRDWDGHLAHDPHGLAPAQVDVCLSIDGPRIAEPVGAHRAGGGLMSGRVLVLGSLNVDLVTRVERHPRPGETVAGEGLQQLAGGKGANQAVAAAAAGASVAMVGCVGDDAGGAAYRRRLEALGVDVAGVRVCPGVPTGTAIVTVADGGENSIVVIPGANDLLDERRGRGGRRARPRRRAARAARGAASRVCTAVRRAAGRGARVVLNTAPYAALPPDVVALADPVVANEHEMAALAEAGAEPRRCS
jgi:hypothetical protein